MVMTDSVNDPRQFDPGGGVVCRCEEILSEEIAAALAAGAATVNDVKRRTRAGMGPARESTACLFIAAMVAQATGASHRGRGADDDQTAGAANPPRGARRS